MFGQVVVKPEHHGCAHLARQPVDRALHHVVQVAVPGGILGGRGVGEFVSGVLVNPPSSPYGDVSVHHHPAHVGIKRGGIIDPVPGLVRLD